MGDTWVMMAAAGVLLAAVVLEHVRVTTHAGCIVDKVPSLGHQSTCSPISRAQLQPLFACRALTLRNRKLSLCVEVLTVVVKLLACGSDVLEGGCDSCKGREHRCRVTDWAVNTPHTVIHGPTGRPNSLTLRTMR